jgi:hypothetical protein
MAIKTGSRPFGKRPPSAVKLESMGAEALSSIGINPSIADPPSTINKIIVIILIPENQNSVSANIFTEKELSKNIRIAKTALHIQTEVLGNHLCINSPEAVNSEPTVTTQVSQYIKPIVNPVAGPIYLVA